MYYSLHCSVNRYRLVCTAVVAVYSCIVQCTAEVYSAQLYCLEHSCIVKCTAGMTQCRAGRSQVAPALDQCYLGRGQAGTQGAGQGGRGQGAGGRGPGVGQGVKGQGLGQVEGGGGSVYFSD